MIVETRDRRLAILAVSIAMMAPEKPFNDSEEARGMWDFIERVRQLCDAYGLDWRKLESIDHG